MCIPRADQFTIVRAPVGTVLNGSRTTGPPFLVWPPAAAETIPGKKTAPEHPVPASLPLLRVLSPNCIEPRTHTTVLLAGPLPLLFAAQWPQQRQSRFAGRTSTRGWTGSNAEGTRLRQVPNTRAAGLSPRSCTRYSLLGPLGSSLAFGTRSNARNSPRSDTRGSAAAHAYLLALLPRVWALPK